MKDDYIGITILAVMLTAIVGFLVSIKHKSDKNIGFHKTYDSLSTELRRTQHERDAFILRFDSLNLRYKDLVSLDSTKTEELKSIKGRYKTKTSQELQKLMIDGAK